MLMRVSLAYISSVFFFRRFASFTAFFWNGGGFEYRWRLTVSFNRTRLLEAITAPLESLSSSSSSSSSQLLQMIDQFFFCLQFFLLVLRRVNRYILSQKWDSESILYTSWWDENLKKTINHSEGAENIYFTY